MALAGFVCLAILFTWPLPVHLQTHLPGSPDGDTGVYVWNLWVFQHELLDHRTLPYFTGTIFASTGPANLSLHNYTTFANLLALPFVRFLGVVATFNLVYLSLTVLAAYAMFLLARHLTRDAAVSWLAGGLFAWSPLMVTRGMGHFSLIAAAPLPIFVLLLVRTGGRPAARDAIAIGATVAWATACDVYYGIYCVMLVVSYLCATSISLIRSERTKTRTAVAVTHAIELLAISMAGLVLALLVSQGWQFTLMGLNVRVQSIYTPVLILTLLIVARVAIHYRPRIKAIALDRVAAGVRVLAAAGVVCAILMSPLLYAFGARVVAGDVEGERVFWRSSPPGVDALALVTPNPNHPLMPDSVRQWVSRLSRDGYLENVASIPLFALLIILGALAIGYRPPAIATAIAVGFGVLALGPFVRVAGIDTHVPAPWALLRYVPLVGLARSPSRFLMVAMVGIALLFAFGLLALATRWPKARTPLMVSAALLVVAELLPSPRVVFSAAVPSIYGVVASDPRDDVRVLELPFGLRDGTMSVGNFTSRTQYYQTAHGKPIIGGYVSRVSRRRVRDSERHPVLGGLIKLSEGRSLSGPEMDQLLEGWPAFVMGTTLGYVVLDRERASEELQALAKTSLRLEAVAEDGPLALYRPMIRRD
jgi:hypothetical protein